MSARRTTALEAFTGPEAAALIESRGGVHIATRGSHMTFVMPNGAEVPCLTKGHVPTVLARVIAKGIGMTYPELRAELRHPVINRTKKPRHDAGRDAMPAVTRADVIATLDALIRDVEGLHALRYGHRDPAFYEVALTVLADTRRALRRMPMPLSTWEPASA